MGSMVVVVDIPGRQGRCMFILAAMKLGVEDLFGHDLLVALDLAVVLGCERPGPAVLGAGGDDAGEGGPAVVGPVVGGHPVDAGDAVDGQEHLLRWYTRAGPCRGLMSWSHFSSSPPGPALLMSLPRQCQQLPTSQQPVAPVTAPIVPCEWHKD